MYSIEIYTCREDRYCSSFNSLHFSRCGKRKRTVMIQHFPETQHQPRQKQQQRPQPHQPNHHELG